MNNGNPLALTVTTNPLLSGWSGGQERLNENGVPGIFTRFGEAEAVGCGC
jgi:hypothetical protein